MNSEQPPKSHRIPIGNMKFVKVHNHKQEPCVNIRDFMTDATTGRMYSTKRGVILSQNEWNTLKRCSDEIDEALKNIKKP